MNHIVSLFILASIAIVHGQGQFRQVFPLISLDGSDTRHPKGDSNPSLAVINPSPVVGSGVNATDAPQPTAIPNAVPVGSVAVNDTNVSTQSPVPSSGPASAVPLVSAVPSTQVPLQTTPPPPIAPVVNVIANGTATVAPVAPVPVATVAPVVPIQNDINPKPNATLKGTYVKTSAIPKSCEHHSDCYDLREPDEWCPLGPTERYSEKGCFCDFARSFCTFQRIGTKGPEYSDCTLKIASTCSGLVNPTQAPVNPTQPPPSVNPTTATPTPPAPASVPPTATPVPALRQI